MRQFLIQRKWALTFAAALLLSVGIAFIAYPSFADEEGGSGEEGAHVSEEGEGAPGIPGEGDGDTLSYTEYTVVFLDETGAELTDSAYARQTVAIGGKAAPPPDPKTPGADSGEPGESPDQDDSSDTDTDARLFLGWYYGEDNDSRFAFDMELGLWAAGFATDDGVFNLTARYEDAADGIQQGGGQTGNEQPGDDVQGDEQQDDEQKDDEEESGLLAMSALFGPLSLDDSYIVHFIKDDYNLTGTDFHTEYVTKTAISRTINPPTYDSDPVLLSKDGYAFKGWYVAAGPAESDQTDTAWNFDTDEVNNDLWLYPKYDPAYMIYFTDGKGTIVDSQKVWTGTNTTVPSDANGDGIEDPGDVNVKSIAEVKKSLSDREIFAEQWYLQGGDPWQTGQNGKISNPTSLYTFGQSLMGSIYLEPVIYTGYYVYFTTQGTPIAPQLVRHGQAAVKPANPSRTGYDFDDDAGVTSGWRLGAADGPNYVFTTPITGDITLWAKWKGKQVNYTVMYWLEKANIPVDTMAIDSERFNKDNYAYAFHEVEQGEAGTLANITQAYANSRIHSAEADKTNSSLWYAEYNFSDQNIVIGGSGATIVNVYCTRQLYDIEFHMVNSYNSGNFRATMRAPNVYQAGTYNNKDKLNTGESVYTSYIPDNKYTLYSVKHGLYIENLCPIYEWIDSNQLDNPYPGLRYATFDITDSSDNPLSAWIQAGWSGPYGGHTIWYNRYTFDMTYLCGLNNPAGVAQNRPSNADIDSGTKLPGVPTKDIGSNSGGWRITFTGDRIFIHSASSTELFDEEVDYWKTQTLTAASPIIQLVDNTDLFVRKAAFPAQITSAHPRSSIGSGVDTEAYNAVTGTYTVNTDPSGDARWPKDQLRNGYSLRTTANDNVWPAGPVFSGAIPTDFTNLTAAPGFTRTDPTDATSYISGNEYYVASFRLRQRYRMTYFLDGGTMTGELGGMTIPTVNGEYGTRNAYGQIIQRSLDGNQIIITAQSDGSDIGTRDTDESVQSHGLQYGRPLGGRAISSTYPTTGLLNFTPLPGQITREGYRFLGWYTDPDYRNKAPNYGPYRDPVTNEMITAINYTMPAGPGALYARWESLDNTVEFYDGLPETFGGTDATLLGKQGVKNGDQVIIPVYYQSGAIVQGKGTFLGWFYRQAYFSTRHETAYPFEMTVYSPVSDEYHGFGSYDLTDYGETVNEGEYDDYPLGAKIPVLLIYAKWKESDFTVIYHEGEGTGTPPVQPGTFNKGVKVLLLNKGGLIPPTGKVFVGWALHMYNIIGSDLYLPGSVIEINGDAELTAQYAAQADLVDIIYNSNLDPSMGGSYPNQTKDQQAPKNINFHPASPISLNFTNDNGIGPDNREFLGWSLDPYAIFPDDPQQVYNSGNNGITLYAIWKDRPNTDDSDFAKQVAQPGSPSNFVDAAVYPAGTDKLTFRLSFTVPADIRGWREVVIEDVLPEELSLDGTPAVAVTVRLNNAAPNPAGTLTLSQDGKTLRYTFAPTTPWKANEGKQVTMTVRTSVDPNFNGGEIVNTGRLLFNPSDPDGGDSTDPDSPDVDIEYPDEIEDLTKQAVSADGTDLPIKAPGSVTNFPAYTEKITYKISFSMPDNTAGYKSVTVQDILPFQLSLDGTVTEAVGVTVNGSPVTITAANTTYENNVISHDLGPMTPARLSELAGADVVMTVKTNVDGQYANIGLHLVNKGRVLVNVDPSDPYDPGDPLDPDGPDGPSDGTEDEGDVPPPPPPDDISNLAKQAVSYDGKDLPEKVSQSSITYFPTYTSKITYRMSFIMPANTDGYIRLIVQDILPAELELDGTVTETVGVAVNGNSVAITALNTSYGNNIVSHDFGDLNVAAARKALEGATVVMTVKAKVKTEYASKRLDFKNIGRVLINYATDVYDPSNPDPDGPDGPSSVVEDPGVINGPGGGGGTNPGGNDGDGDDDDDDDNNNDDDDDNNNGGGDDDDDDNNGGGGNDNNNGGGSPDPSTPGHSIIPGGDGSYIELDENGGPLGEWRYDPDSGDRIFDEYPPLAGALPQTGRGLIERSEQMMWLISFAWLIILAGLLYFERSRRRADRNRWF
ncbi:MAG: isopeptide-forming domain-containing fimbrial protein [Clostridiales Family XIII bacterium]|jgi:fimbrial isopeptide formation D2 family protein|nr:isopeptide-forming domain-containing fimbrial protein [Clostridiales Family XIII bacterium]